MNFFKRELKAKLSCDHILYCPKLLVQKYKNNKLVKKEFNILGDYLFCYDKQLKNKEILAKLKFIKGLKCVLNGFSSSQDEIIQFIDQCKKFEDPDGYITQNFFQPQEDFKYKFVSGPFVNTIFQIINHRFYHVRLILAERNFNTLRKIFLYFIYFIFYLINCIN